MVDAAGVPRGWLQVVYVDSRRPRFVDGVATRTFAAMVNGVRESADHSRGDPPGRFNAGVDGVAEKNRERLS